MDDDTNMAKMGRSLGAAIKAPACGIASPQPRQRPRTRAEKILEMIEAMRYLMADYESYCKANGIACPNENFAHRRAYEALLAVQADMLRMCAAQAGAPLLTAMEVLEARLAQQYCGMHDAGHTHACNGAAQWIIGGGK
jgi:hypothetical protein